MYKRQDVECNLFYNRASHFLVTQPETRVYENAGSLDMGGVEVVARYKADRLSLEMCIRDRANRMQQQAELARERARAAQLEAEKAYRMADEQKNLAMERQLQAEQSKRVADTLAFLALGR